MSTQIYFLWRNKKNISMFWLKKALCVELCSTVDIKTTALTPLSRSAYPSPKCFFFSFFFFFFFFFGYST